MNTIISQQRKRGPYSRLATRFALGILLFLLAVSQTMAAGDTVTVLGHITCKEWQEDRKKDVDGAGLDALGAELDKSWLRGFLTGVNVAFNATGGSKNALGAIDTETMSLWIDRYCSAHPKSDLFDAGTELFLALKKITK